MSDSAGQQTTEGGNRSDEVPDKSPKKSGGRFRSTFTFSFGRKRSTESSKTQETSDHQEGQSAETKTKSGQAGEVPPVSEDRGREDTLPKAGDSSVENKQSDGKVIQPSGPPQSDDTIENTGQSTEQQGQEDRQKNIDQLQQASTAENQESPPDAEKSSDTEEHREDQVLQSTDILESFDPIVNTGQSTVQQKEEHDDCENKDQLQQAATSDNQEALPESEKSSETEEHSEDQVLQPADILESFDPIVNMGQSTVQQKEGDECENKDQLQQAATPDKQDDFVQQENVPILDSEQSTMENKETEDQVLQSADILEYSDPKENTGHSTVQQEDEAGYKNDNQLQRQVSPGYEDFPPDPEESLVENTQYEEHSEGRVLYSSDSDILESFDPIVQDDYKKKDEAQVSPDYQDAPTDKEESSEQKEHSEDQLVQSSDILESFDPLDNTKQYTGQPGFEDEDKDNEQPQRIPSASSDFYDALFDTEEFPGENKHEEDRVLPSSDILDSFDPIVQHENEGKHKKGDQPQMRVTPDHEDLPQNLDEPSVQETKEQSADKVLESSTILESFDPFGFANIEHSTVQLQDDKKKEEQTQRQVTPGYQDAPLDPEESSLKIDHSDTFSSSKAFHVKVEQKDKDKHKKEDQTQSTASPDDQDALPDTEEPLKQPSQGQEDKVPDQTKFEGLEYQDISAHKDQSLLEDSQDEDNDDDDSLLWFDTPEYFDEPQPEQPTSGQKQDEENDGVNLVQSSDIVKVPQDLERPQEQFGEQGKSQVKEVSQDSLLQPQQFPPPVQKQLEEPDNSRALQSSDILEFYDDKEEHRMRNNRELSNKDTAHHKKESQEHASDLQQGLPFFEDADHFDAPTLQDLSVVQQHQADKNDTSQDLLLTEGPEERDVSTIAEQSAVEQYPAEESEPGQVIVPSESLEDLPHTKKPVVQEDQQETGNVPAPESDGSEFYDEPKQDEDDKASHTVSTTDQKVSPTVPTKEHKGKEPDTAQAPPLSESTEDNDVLPHSKQPVGQQEKIKEKETGDVSSDSDSSEFQDVPLHDDEDEASQSDSSKDKESSTLYKQSITQQRQRQEQETSEVLPLSEDPKDKNALPHKTIEKERDVSSESGSSEFDDVPLEDVDDEASESSSSTDQEAPPVHIQSTTHQRKGKEHATSKTIPLPESQKDQKDKSLPEQPTVQVYEAEKEKNNQGIQLSEGKEILGVSPNPEQHEERKIPTLSEGSKPQQDKAKDDDLNKVLLFDPEDQGPPLSEGSTDQDDKPLQYFNTSSESDSSEFQDVSSDDEDVSTVPPELAQVRQHQAEEQKSQLPEGLKGQDTSSHAKQSTVQKHKTEERDRTKMASESDSDDVPSPVERFPKQRFEEKGVDKSRTSVESDILEDEGVMLSPLTPQPDKHNLALESSEDVKRKQGRAISPKPHALENRLLEANATIATLLEELDQVRGEIKERANITTDQETESKREQQKESEYRHESDTQTPVSSAVEIGVNTEGDSFSQTLETKADSNTAMGDNKSKKPLKTVSRGIQTDFTDSTDSVQAKSEDVENVKGKKPTGKTDTKSKKKSAMVEMLNEDEELRATSNIAENLKRALAAKSKSEQQGKAEAPPPPEEVKVEEIRHLDRIIFGGKGSDPGKFNRPRGVAVSPKSEIFVADRDNRRIQVHNMKGETIRQIPTTVPGQENLTMRPDDIAIDGNDLLWIVGSDWSTEFVIPYTMEGEPLGKFHLPDTVRFRGITVNPRNDHVIVSLTDKTFGTRGEVRIFRPDGYQLRRVGINQGMVAPMFVTLDKEDNILVSDYGTHSVYAYDQEGTFLFKFGGYGSGVGQLKDPRGICVDSSGNIIVADFGNKRLEMFTNRGKFLRHVTDSTGRPDGIAVGPDGQLVVTEWNHTASIIPSY
ncbi:transcriptional regulator ATRX-like [Branchiostoma floridae]|uniref:Transcriptional regulator ATRX-like n=1 Tax=Branchiostoma floridae TaxID=7739 RepID=A0A9J7M0R8_BRAFL|nr:transcriptional regulator ATRX-like [Branchiostoma floridae]